MRFTVLRPVFSSQYSCFMKRKIIQTGDGSNTIHLPGWNEQYHSKHGALQEALHVFIKNGLSEMNGPTLDVLEVGFGTGLNALLTAQKADKEQLNIHYTGLEAFPLLWKEIEELRYDKLVEQEKAMQWFEQMHSCQWEVFQPITSNFKLCKRQIKLQDYHPAKASFDLIYFDAFGPRVQPEMWDLEHFKQLFKALRSGGLLVTYCAKGQVRRDMKTAGFTVERLPGPPGKREMLRAQKK